MTDQRRHTPGAVHVDLLEAPTPHTRVLWPDGMACRHQRAALRRRDLLGWVATAVLLGGGRAALPAASATRLRVGVASCADQRQPQPLWDAVLTEQPDFSLPATTSTRVHSLLTSPSSTQPTWSSPPRATLRAYARLCHTWPCGTTTTMA
jgi:hypothetical protein